jgi:Domain of unknown function (DUF3472)/Domain of unknown function (DUF5077)
MKLMRMPLIVAALLGSTALLSADDAVPPKAARSVHLSYISQPAVSFYAEVTVEKSVPDSYFQVCGFNGGYFGIQEHEHGKKVGIFSVWDTSKGNDPKAVDKKDQVEKVFVGDGVRASRFGGEGTGGHSDFDFNWNIGDTYKFFLTSKIKDNKTEYAAYIFEPEKKSWMHVATFAAPDGGKKLTGLYSFIEDFRRDTKSATEVRRAHYSNQWVMLPDGKWDPVTKAKFTASGASWEAKDTINAGVEDKSLFLQTGGDTKMETKLHDTITRPDADMTPPADLPKLDE